MSHTNLCVFTGYLGSDVDLRFMPNGDAVGNVSMASTERYKDKVTGEAQEITTWVRLVMFGKRAEVLAEYCKKGSRLLVKTKYRTRTSEKDGQKSYWHEFIIQDFEFLDKRENAEGDTRAQAQAGAYGGSSSSRQQPPQQPPAQGGGGDAYDFDDDLPF